MPGGREAPSDSQRRAFIYLFQVDVMSALGTVQTSKVAPIPILLTAFEPRSPGPSRSLRWPTSGLGLLETPSRRGWGRGLLQRQRQIPAALTGWFSSKDLEVLDSQTRLFGVMVSAGPMACPAPGHRSPLPPDSHHFGAQDLRARLPEAFSTSQKLPGPGVLLDGVESDCYKLGLQPGGTREPRCGALQA